MGDAFWSQVSQNVGADTWNVRAQVVDEEVRGKVRRAEVAKRPVRCLELGTYCGYSALRIAKNFPAGSMLVSVEKDELFAAIATKIIEFAGLGDKVKIWMGTVHSEIAQISERLEKEPADFILCDHSKDRF